jgi:hypothetical protein
LEVTLFCSALICISFKIHSTIKDLGETVLGDTRPALIKSIIGVTLLVLTLLLDPLVEWIGDVWKYPKNAEAIKEHDAESSRE